MVVLESQYSAQINAMADDAIAPKQVVGLAHLVSQGKVSLSWNAVTTNEDDTPILDLGGYRIFRKKTAEGALELIGSVDEATTAYEDATAKDGASYVYAVAAIDNEVTPNEGTKSADLAVKTIPSIPTGLNATGFDSKIRLDWTSVASEVDTDLNENLAGYNIYRSETDGTDYVKIGNVEKAVLTYDDLTAVNGTTYYYVITSIDNSI